MEETVKERLMMYLKEKNITRTAFEKAAGLSNGYMLQLRNSPGLEKLSRILSAYPDLNRSWLLTGEGNMIKSNEEEGTTNPSDSDVVMRTSDLAEFKVCMIDKLINHYSLGDITDFANKLKVSRNTVENWKAQGKINAELIFERCPDISAVWLLTGKGNMFCCEGQEMDRALAEIDYLKGKIAAYEGILKAKGLL